MLSSGVENIKQADRGSKAVLAAMVVQSLFTAFIKSTNPNALNNGIPGSDGTPTSSSTLDDDDFDYNLAPGAVLKLKPDEDITFANPSQPKNEFEAFMMAHLVWVGMATGIPYEILSKKFLSSYSASRASRIEAWRFFLAERSKFNRDFNQVIYQEWLTIEILEGRIPALGFFDSDDMIQAYCRAEWLGSSMGQIDEKKEVDAAISRIDAGLSTWTAETAAMNGGDFTRNAKRLQREATLIAPYKKIIGEQQRAAEAPLPPPVPVNDNDDQDKLEASNA
jgi:capsid protein